MKKLILILGLFIAFQSFAQQPHPGDPLQAYIDYYLPDNTSRSISPFDLRTTLYEISDSTVVVYNIGNLSDTTTLEKVAGNLIYVKLDGAFYYYDGTKWALLETGGGTSKWTDVTGGIEYPESTTTGDSLFLNTNKSFYMVKQRDSAIIYSNKKLVLKVTDKVDVQGDFECENVVDWNSADITFSGDIEFKGGIDGVMKIKAIPKLTSFSANITEVLDGISYLCVNPAELIITLPAVSTIPNDGYIHIWEITHPAPGHNIKIVSNGTDTLAYGNTYFNLGTHIFAFALGGYNTGTSAIWGLRRNLTVKGIWERNATWAAANFSSLTIVPFDNESKNNQDEILEYNSTTDRVVVTTPGAYNVSATLMINSTGGGAWEAIGQVYKNSVAQGIPIKTGNYGNEDGVIPIQKFSIDCALYDTLDVRLVQTNLTGELLEAVFFLDIRL